MKKVILWGTLLVSIISTFIACKKDKGVTEEVSLNVSFTIQSDSTNFSVVYTLDSATLSNVMGGDMDNIKTLELLEAKYMVTDYNGPTEQQITATLYVSGAGYTDNQELGTITNQNLASLVNNEQTLVMKQTGVERFAILIINSPHSALLTFTGLSSPDIVIGYIFLAKLKFKYHKDNPT